MERCQKEKRRSFAIAAIIGVTACAAFVRADPAQRPSSGSWGASGSYAKLRKSGREARVKGNVLSSEEFVPGPGMEPGVALKLATPNGDFLVHLGPRWFILENDLNFTRGEPLTVIGLKINFDRKPVILADEIVKGEQKIDLRDTGTPRRSLSKGPETGD